MNELRQAWRSLGRTRWFTGTIVAVMALCISLSTTVFAIVDGVLFKPLPYARPWELYFVTGGFIGNNQRRGISIAPRNLRDWAAAVPGATATLLSTGLSTIPFGDVRGWAPIVGQLDPHCFDVLGVQPLAGGFTAEDYAFVGPARRALISYATWQREFGGRPDVVGAALPSAATLPGRVVTVAGVMPRGFVFPWFGQQPDVFVPLVVDPARQNDLRFRQFTGIVRIPPADALPTAQARMDGSAAAELVDWVPRPQDGTPGFTHAALDRLDERLTRAQRPTFSLVFAAAATLVLLGCLNISGLLATRVLDRRQDIAIRRALGAGGASIARNLLAEHALVVAAGATSGVLLSGVLLRLTLRLMPQGTGLLKRPGIDWRVLTFALAASVVAVLVVSAWPVWRAVRRPTGGSNEGARLTERNRSAGRFVVISAQVAIGFALTVGGALLVGSLIQVWRIDPGFASDEVVLLQGRAEGNTPEAREAALTRFERAVRAVPGVRVVGSTRAGFGSGMMMNAFMDGATVGVRPGFFEAMSMTLLAGRWPTDDELLAGAPVAVLSRRAAARTFHEASPIGKQIRGFAHGGPQPFDVIGVADDIKMTSWDANPLGQVFAPFAIVNDDQPWVSVVARSTQASQALRAILPILERSASDVKISSAALAADLLVDTVRARRLNSWLFGGFATAALTIVAVGIFGLTAMNAARRTREIGVRVALGATPGRIRRQLLTEQMLPIAAGLFAGGALSLWALRFVRAFLFHLDGADSRIWFAAAALMASVALASVAVPSARASHIDPASALRGD